MKLYYSVKMIKQLNKKRWFCFHAFLLKHKFFALIRLEQLTKSFGSDVSIPFFASIVIWKK